MGEPVGSYRLHAFPDRKDELLSRFRATNPKIDQSGTRFEIRERVRIAKKLIRSKKLTGADGKKLVLYYCYEQQKFLHENLLKALAVALKVLDKQSNKENQFFIITKEG